MKINMVVMILTLSFSVSSKNFGVFGDVFLIQEKNMLTLINQNLVTLEEQGAFENLKNEMVNNAIQTRERPIPVLTKTTDKYSERLFDPTMTLTKDLTDHEGVIFARKGDKFNPLDYIPLSKKMFFIDGDNPKQIEWLLSQSLTLKDKIILTNGNPLEIEQSLDRVVFFDQNAELIKRFDIHVVPSVISPKGNKLLIREIFINE